MIVEYPLSPYADDALLSLAELEQARGDRAAAYQHLQRFVREHPASPARARAGLAAARLAFEQRDMPHGCAMIADARRSAARPTSSFAIRSSIYGSHCSARDRDAPGRRRRRPRPRCARRSDVSARRRGTRPAPPRRATAASAARQRQGRRQKTDPRSADARHAEAPARPRQRAEGMRRPPTRRAHVRPAERTARGRAKQAPRGIWTIQLAAYNTKADAEATGEQARRARREGAHQRRRRSHSAFGSTTTTRGRQPPPKSRRSSSAASSAS